MAYCTITEVESVLAQALTSATDPINNTRRNLLLIGNVRDKNVIPDDIVNQYLQWSSQEIDSILGQLYQTPVCSFVDFETVLAADINEYNPYVVVDRACPLAVDDTVILMDGSTEEGYVISEIVAYNVFATIDPILYYFTAGSRVLRVKFPDPLPWICARLTAANIYDKYFSSQVSPDISNYGKFLREQARAKINDILNGRTILHGVRRIGRALYDPNIVTQYGLMDGNPSAREIDKLS